MSAVRAFYGISLAIGIAGAVACSSDSSGGGGGGGAAPGADGAAARDFFVTKVYPSIESTCAKCHFSGDHGAPLFLPGDGPSSYTAIDGVTGLISAPNQSPIVQHGLHAGPALTSNQGDLVTQWLNMEVKARGLSGNAGKPANLRAAFAAFGKCMDWNEWQQLG